MYKLGEHIRYYRQQLGWTQQQLADRLRVSRPVLSRWETGQLTPDLFQAAALSDIFDVSIDRLVGLDQDKETLLREVREAYAETNARERTQGKQKDASTFSAPSKQTEENGPSDPLQNLIDDDMVVILHYLHRNQTIKAGLLSLAETPPRKRKGVEKMLTVALQDVLNTIRSSS